MRCITLWQPWAEACIVGDKVFETRPRPMKARGTIGIHAALKPVKAANLGPKLCRLLTARWGDDWLDRITYGAIIGTVDVVDCVQMTAEMITGLSYQERMLGDWQVGRWAYRLEYPHRFEFPIAARGFQAMPWELTL